MKKFRVLLVLLLTACLLFLCSCGGSVKTDKIRAKAMFTNQELVLPIHSDHALFGMLRPSGMYGFMTFGSNETVEELYDKIRQADSTLTCTLKDNYILISRDNSYGAKDFFWIEGSKSGNGYSFSGMRAGLVTGIESNGMRQSRAVLLPYHLLSDTRISGLFVELYLNAEYETTAGLEEFLGFYQDSGWYEVEQKDGCVLINGYKNPDAVVDNPDDADGYGTLSFDAPLEIRFRDFGDKRYFSFTEAE